MKINPVSIQAYQQPARREAPVSSSEKSRPVGQAADKVVIEPQENSNGSSLAVKAPGGTYAEYLTEAETQALEMLFSKFRANGERFGSGYAGDSEMSGPEANVGLMIDVKV
jgi:hypothetical protein